MLKHEDRWIFLLINTRTSSTCFYCIHTVIYISLIV